MSSAKRSKKGKGSYQRYRDGSRKESNQLRRQRRQLANHPNDTSNPLHADYVVHDANDHRKVEETRSGGSLHPSVFDGKSRGKKKARRVERPLGYLASVPIS